MKEIMLFVNFCFTVIGAVIVLVLFGIDQDKVSKETSLTAFIIWCYVLCNFIAIKKRLNEK
jgi:hypothetical protein